MANRPKQQCPDCGRWFVRISAHKCKAPKKQRKKKSDIKKYEGYVVSGTRYSVKGKRNWLVRLIDPIGGTGIPMKRPMTLFWGQISKISNPYFRKDKSTGNKLMVEFKMSRGFMSKLLSQYHGNYKKKPIKQLVM